METLRHGIPPASPEDSGAGLMYGSQADPQSDDTLRGTHTHTQVHTLRALGNSLTGQTHTYFMEAQNKHEGRDTRKYRTETHANRYKEEDRQVQKGTSKGTATSHTTCSHTYKTQTQLQGHICPETHTHLSSMQGLSHRHTQIYTTNVHSIRDKNATTQVHREKNRETLNNSHAVENSHSQSIYSQTQQLRHTGPSMQICITTATAGIQGCVGTLGRTLSQTKYGQKAQQSKMTG